MLGIARSMKRSQGPRSAAAIEIDSEGKASGRLDPGIGEIGLVLAVTLLGDWLRFRALGRDSLWFDEVFSTLQAHLPFWDLLLELLHRDVQPPLHHLLLRGVLTFGDSEAVLRFPSAFFGTLSIPLLYLLGRTWFSGSVGALAALLLAISPFHLWHSQDARMYSLLTFEGIASWYLFGRLLTVSRVSLWVGYLLASTAILYTHYYGALLLIPQTSVVILLRHRGEIDSSFSPRWLRAQAGLVLLFVPWLALTGRSIPFNLPRWIERLDPLTEVSRVLVALTSDYRGHHWEAIGLQQIPRAVVWLQRALILGLAIIGLVRDDGGNWRTPRAALRERRILLCLGYFAAPIVMMLSISLLRPLLVNRHLLMIAPPFFLLVALGLSRVLPRRITVAEVALLALLVVLGVIAGRSTPRTADYRGAAAVIAGEATPGDVLLVYHEHPRLILKYYLRSREPQLRWCPQSLRDASLEATQGCLDGVRRVWVVSGEESGKSRQADLQAALETEFKPVRSESLVRARVFLYERR